MAITRCFGLPGSGKTTLLTYFAVRGIRDPRYQRVFGNVHLNIPGYTFVPFECFGVYEMTDCLLLIDEATIECGDRDYKSLSKEKLARFMMHRHDNMDIVLFSQSPDGTDKKIRDITDRMYYIKKGFLLGKWVSTIYRVPYKVIWPSSENNGGENAGRILMGYVKPTFLHRLFALRLIRQPFYKYFDSWERIPLSKLPSVLPKEMGGYKIQTIPQPLFYNGWEKDCIICTGKILIRYRVRQIQRRIRSFIKLFHLYEDNAVSPRTM